MAPVKSKDYFQFNERTKCGDCSKWHDNETVETVPGFTEFLDQLGALQCNGGMKCDGECIKCCVQLINEHEDEAAIYKHEKKLEKMKHIYQGKDPAIPQSVRRQARLDMGQDKAIFHVAMALKAGKKPCLSYLDKCFRRCEPNRNYIGYANLWRFHKNYMEHDEWVELTGECQLLIEPVWFTGTTVYQIPVEIQPAEGHVGQEDTDSFITEVFVRSGSGRHKIAYFNMFIDEINKHGLMEKVNCLITHLSLRELLSTRKWPYMFPLQFVRCRLAHLVSVV